MKNVLIYSLWGQGYQEACQLEAANRHITAGDNILFVTCGTKVGFCNENTLGCKIECKICKRLQKIRAIKWTEGKVNVKSIDDFITKDMISLADRMTFDYADLESLKELTYEGVEIGYGAVSSYVTNTRNIEPEINNVKPYLDALLRMEVSSVLAFKEIFRIFKPDLVIFHNGRFAHFKAILGVAQHNNIDFISTETVTAYDKSVQQNNYINCIPHDMEYRAKLYKSFYDGQPETSDKEKVGASFFENRKNAIFSGDTIYVKDQKKGKMPEGWKGGVENIVIFNSSEDEFFAIAKKYKSVALFKSQIDGIVSILEHYKDDNTKHFTVRVHPHLINLPFNYHVGLYKLNYPNLTVIPADSPVSSYALMDAADKVITFGSTMGIESAYWQKPSICLAFSFYRYLNVTYNPQSLDELWALIDNKELRPKPKANCLPYGFFLMSNKHENFKYINLKKAYYFNFFGKKILGYSYYNILGSTLLYNYVKRIWDNIREKHSFMSQFKTMPL